MSNTGLVPTIRRGNEELNERESFMPISPRVVLVFMCILCANATAAVWFVDVDNVAGPWDGMTWATAFDNIQDGVYAAYADSGGEVWVAEGTYTDTGYNVVVMDYGVHIYGGFAGTETLLSERNYSKHPTIIDGEDTRQCVRGADNATLDGFTITRGYAYEGPGMCNYYSSPSVANCIFSYNTAEGDRGGGMFNFYSSPTLTNCMFLCNVVEGESTLYTLTIAVSDDGTTNPPPGTYPEVIGAEMSIQAIPDTGYCLERWDTDPVDYWYIEDRTAPTTSVTIISDVTVTPVFLPSHNHDITVIVNGNGNVVLDVDDVPEVPASTYSFPHGTDVTLTATPDANWDFANWHGDVEDFLAPITTIRADADKEVTATFVPITVVDFPDRAFEAIIREAISKPSGDILSTDLLSLTDLDASYPGKPKKRISSIDGIEYCINLRRLSLYDNAIVDLTPLGGLINLEWLDIGGNLVSDMTALTGLTNLNYLDASYNTIADLSPLANLTSLVELNLSGNNIVDVSWLNGLTNVEELYLAENSITDLAPLCAPTVLLQQNLVQDLSQGLSALSVLDLSQNQITDIAPEFVANPPLGPGDGLSLILNPLSTNALCNDIPSLEAMGIYVAYIGECVGGEGEGEGEGEPCPDPIVLLDLVTEPADVSTIEAEALNNNCEITGSAYFPSSMFPEAGIHVFYWDPNDPTRINDFGVLRPEDYNPASCGVDINDEGYITGYSSYIFPILVTDHPFLLNAHDPTIPIPVMRDLGVLDPEGRGLAHALGINNNNIVCGFGHQVQVQDQGSCQYSACIWMTQGPGAISKEFVKLPDKEIECLWRSTAWKINNNGWVVGNSQFGEDSDYHAVLWKSDTEIVPLEPFEDDSFAYGIGEYDSAEGHTHIVGSINGRAVLWTYKDDDFQTTEELGEIGGPGGAAFAINNSHQIVGRCWVSGSHHSFLWDDTYRMQDLVDSFGADGVTGGEAVDINDAGDILIGYPACLIPACAYKNPPIRVRFEEDKNQNYGFDNFTEREAPPGKRFIWKSVIKGQQDTMFTKLNPPIDYDHVYFNSECRDGELHAEVDPNTPTVPEDDPITINGKLAGEEMITTRLKSANGIGLNYFKVACYENLIRIPTVAVIPILLPNQTLDNLWSYNINQKLPIPIAQSIEDHLNKIFKQCGVEFSIYFKDEPYGPGNGPYKLNYDHHFSDNDCLDYNYWGGTYREKYKYISEPEFICWAIDNSDPSTRDYLTTVGASGKRADYFVFLVREIRGGPDGLNAGGFSYPRQLIEEPWMNACFVQTYLNGIIIGGPKTVEDIIAHELGHSYGNLWDIEDNHEDNENIMSWWHRSFKPYASGEKDFLYGYLRKGQWDMVRNRKMKWKDLETK